MESGATFLYTDILTAGWSPSGERFTYDTVQLINEVYLDGELAVFDHIKLTPARQNMTGLGFLEGFTHLGSMIVVSEKTNSILLDKLYELICSIGSNHIKFGLSKLPVDGFSIRVLANSTQMIERVFAECHRLISQEWFDTIPSSLRKY